MGMFSSMLKSAVTTGAVVGGAIGATAFTVAKSAAQGVWDHRGEIVDNVQMVTDKASEIYSVIDTEIKNRRQLQA